MKDEAMGHWRVNATRKGEKYCVNLIDPEGQYRKVWESESRKEQDAQIMLALALRRHIVAGAKYKVGWGWLFGLASLVVSCGITLVGLYGIVSGLVGDETNDLLAWGGPTAAGGLLAIFAGEAWKQAQAEWALRMEQETTYRTYASMAELRKSLPAGSEWDRFKRKVDDVVLEMHAREVKWNHVRYPWGGTLTFMELWKELPEGCSHPAQEVFGNKADEE